MWWAQRLSGNQAMRGRVPGKDWEEMFPQGGNGYSTLYLASWGSQGHSVACKQSRALGLGLWEARQDNGRKEKAWR